MSVRILAYEYLSTGALAGQPGAASLAREGQAMLTAVLEDLAGCPEVQVLTVVSADLLERVRQAVPGCEIHAADLAREEEQLRRLARTADWALVIAPEFDDILARRCQWALDEGSRLLGPTPLGVRLTGDKLWLAGHLLKAGVPTPATRRLEAGEAPLQFPFLIKPRCGAGSQAIFTVRQPSDVLTSQAQAIKAGWAGELIAQEIVPSYSQHYSIVWLIGPKERRPLLPADQHLSRDGRFRYKGGLVPSYPHVHGRITRVSGEALRAVPGLQGYVGVDVVLSSKQKRPDWVVEINPRLTTSYVGLRRVARFNILLALLQILQGRPPGPMEWRQDRKALFTPDGAVQDVPPNYWYNPYA